MNTDTGKPVDMHLKDVKPDSAYYYNITPGAVNFRIPGNLIDNPQKASDEAKRLSDWIAAKNGQRILVKDNPTGLDYVVCNKDSMPISYQLFTDALTGRIENIPDYIKSWDRLNLKQIENINGENYLRFEQEPSHDSWLSTRWDQIFNHLKFTPGNRQDEELMKDIVAFNVKKQYGFDLDKSKIVIKGHRDAIGNWGVFDVLYAGEAPENIVKNTNGSTTTGPRHVLIQEKVPIWIKQSQIPLERILYQTPVPATPDTAKPASADTSSKAKPDISKAIYKLTAFGGYGKDVRNEKDNQANFDLISQGPIAGLYASADGKHLYADANGRFMFVNGKIHDLADRAVVVNGQYHGNGYRADVEAGLKIGDKSYFKINGNWHMIGDDKVIVFDDPAIKNAESQRMENDGGLGIALGAKGNKATIEVGAEGFAGKYNQNDHSPDGQGENSTANVFGYIVNGKLVKGPLELRAHYGQKTYDPQSGFTQGRTQTSYGTDARLDLGRHFGLVGGLEGTIEDINQRAFNARQTDWYLGTAYKF